MKKNGFLFLSLLLATTAGFSSFHRRDTGIIAPEFISYVVDPGKQTIGFFWKDGNGKQVENFQNLKQFLEKENRELVFAMNGGMFNADLSPQGLYIENGKLLSGIDTVQNAYGNFYLQPNGIFYLTDERKPVVCKTADFVFSEQVQYATQSGPMLVIDGFIHPKFVEGSANLNVRNGVGILPDGRVLFAMSKNKINLYDFARFFKEKGCSNALYLDGAISKTYLPSANQVQLDGLFGVIIAETREKQ